MIRIRQRRSEGDRAATLFARVYAHETLTRAWLAVRAARGRAGIDGVSLATFERHALAHLTALAHELRDESYLPLPAQRFGIARGDGTAREIGVLAVRDRIAQRAVHDVLSPLYERRFLTCSHGYRPGRSTAQAIAAVLQARDAGYQWVVDADISDFFGSLDHTLLLREVSHVGAEPPLLRLIERWLLAGLFDPAIEPPSIRAALPQQVRRGVDLAIEWGIHTLGQPDLAGDALDALPSHDARGVGLRRTVSGLALLLLSSTGGAEGALRGLVARRPPTWSLVSGGAILAATTAGVVLRTRQSAPQRGTLQGAVLSPLLANAYLHPLDLALTRRYPHLVRYADDLLILCRDEAEARAALADLRTTLAALHLSLHEGKTSLHHVDTPFRFLGYSISAGHATPPEGSTLPECVRRLGQAARPGVARLMPPREQEAQPEGLIPAGSAPALPQRRTTLAPARRKGVQRSWRQGDHGSATARNGAKERR